MRARISVLQGLRMIWTFSTSEGEGQNDCGWALFGNEDLHNQYESMKLREAKVTTGGGCYSRAFRYRGEGRGVRG